MVSKDATWNKNTLVYDNVLSKWMRLKLKQKRKEGKTAAKKERKLTEAHTQWASCVQAE